MAYYAIIILVGKAVLYLHDKFYLDDETTVEMKIWEVKNDDRFPEGYKYSLFATKGKEIIIGYDNHHPKGHHYHVGPKEYPYAFKNIDDLVSDFLSHLQKKEKKKI